MFFHSDMVHFKKSRLWFRCHFGGDQHKYLIEQSQVMLEIVTRAREALRWEVVTE